MSFGRLLQVLGRSEDMVNVFTLPDGLSHWTTASRAEDEAARWSGEQNVYFGVQPMAEVLTGRGKSRDVSSVVTLYADLDFVSDEKPDGMTKETAVAIIEKLSEALGTPPGAVVVSGHGLQPYWPIEAVETVSGALLLLRWRQLVIQVAAEFGVTVDTGVYDLPRILRVPGPPNLKYGQSAKTSVQFREHIRLSEAEVNAVLDAHLVRDEVTRQYDRDTMRLVRSDVSTGDRVFTDEQALAFLDEFAFTPARETPWGAGADYWKILWQCAMCCSNFTEMFDEDDLKDQLRQAVSSGHDDASLDVNDEYQIALGFLKGREWLARRPSAEELSNPFSPYCNLKAREATEREIEARQRYDIPAEVPLTTDVAVETAAEAATSTTQGLILVWGSEMAEEGTEWLWEYGDEFWLPLGELVLLGGREGVGKSTWTARLIAQITRGTMHGKHLGSPKSVIVCAAEDSWTKTLLPRFKAAGADVSRVARADVRKDAKMRGLLLPTDIPAVEKAVRDHDVAMIVLDPLLGTVEGKLDTHKDSDVRQALDPLTRLAHDCEITIIGLIHQNKSQGGDMMTRMMGSRAFGAVARTVLVCAEADVDELPSGEFDLLAEAQTKDVPRRAFRLGQIKNNLGPKVPNSIKYEIEGVDRGKDSKGTRIRTSRISIKKGTDGTYEKDKDIETIVAAKEKSGAKDKNVGREDLVMDPDLKKSKVEEAMEFIADQMAIHPEGVSASEMVKAMESLGFSAGTYSAARAKLGVVSKKSGSKWLWRMQNMEG